MCHGAVFLRMQSKMSKDLQLVSAGSPVGNPSSLRPVFGPDAKMGILGEKGA